MTTVASAEANGVDGSQMGQMGHRWDRRNTGGVGGYDMFPTSLCG